MLYRFIFVFVCAVFLSPAFQAKAEEIVRLIPPKSLPVSKTEVLSSSDKDVYLKIFSELDNNDFTQAETDLKTVENGLLSGYVLAQIYLAENAQPTKKQLGEWLKKYADLPIAEPVYDLAAKKKAPLPRKKPSDPAAHMVAGACTSMQIADPIDLVFFKRASYVPEEFKKKVRMGMLYFSSAIRRGKTRAAKLHLDDRYVKKYLSQKDRDDSLTALAFAYFIDRQDKKAWETIQEPLKRAETRNPTAYWVAGLTAFRMQKWDEAEKAFKALTTHPKAIPTQRAAAAFWTTRSLLKAQRYQDVSFYLKQAAFVSPNSFYGILAQRALGWPIGHSWKNSELEEPDMDAVLAEPGGQRAVALVQIGQMEFAEKELIKLYAEKKDLRKQLLAYAESVVEYPDLSVRLAALSGEVETPDGDNALYPYPNWTPTNGWQIDKALAYAFIRQESCFKNKAFSKAGARGVMQLMPATARLMAHKLKQPYQLSRLHKIPYNLMIGQELIKTLLNYPAIDGNLLMTIASYNCGPRNTAKWKDREDFKNDPLMFAEAIPSRETRGFVKKVTANYWIYRNLFGEDLSSIDDVLAGRYPVYKPD
ncbi:MAG: lytic transglycosylase domain-containing protein [Alphaproteobacteria bacterium]|nr:lytic transglycosylase domain-containing protein [Alphaproteobacteria bacterium]